MKKVLILAYYFPPIGMGGTQRAAKFARYLPEFGWQPHVITVKDVAYHAKDPSLLTEIESVPIHRTGSLDPLRLARIVSGRSTAPESSRGTRGLLASAAPAMNWLFAPDSKLLWLPFAYRHARRVLLATGASCVFTSSPPHSVHLVGALLQKFHQVRWVADFRDGWAGGNFQSEPTFFHRWLNRKLEARVLDEADAVVSVSAGLTERLRIRCGCRDKFHTISNGFDRADFRVEPVHKIDKSYRIVYCGALTRMTPLQAFLAGLQELLQANAANVKQVRLILVGAVLDAGLKELVSELGLQSVVEFAGYCDHRKAVEYMQSADLLLYPVADHASSDFVPGKTFEYLAAGKRIIVVGPQVEGVRILERHSNAVIRTAHKATKIAGALAGILSQKNAASGVCATGIDEFERQHLTRRLAAVLAG